MIYSRLYKLASFLRIHLPSSIKSSSTRRGEVEWEIPDCGDVPLAVTSANGDLQIKLKSLKHHRNLIFSINTFQWRMSGVPKQFIMTIPPSRVKVRVKLPSSEFDLPTRRQRYINFWKHAASQLDITVYQQQQKKKDITDRSFSELM